MKRLPPPGSVSSATRRRILRYILEEVKRPYRIAKLMGLDKKTVRYHLDKLLVAKLVSFDLYSWDITELGKSALLEKSGQETGQVIPPTISNGSTARVIPRISKRNEGREKTPKVGSAQGWGTERAPEGVSVRVRYHKIWLNMGKIERRELIGERKKFGSSWYSDMAVADSTLRLFGNGRLMAKLPPFWGRTPEDAEAEMKRYVVDWGVMVRDSLGCSIGGVWQVSQGEVAFVGHELAKKYQAKKIKLNVRDENGKLWLIVDQSLGTPELETVSPVEHLPDAKIINDFFNKLRDGYFTDLALGLAQQSEVLKQVSVTQQVILKEVTALGGFRQ